MLFNNSSDVMITSFMTKKASSPQGLVVSNIAFPAPHIGKREDPGKEVAIKKKDLEQVIIRSDRLKPSWTPYEVYTT